MATDVDRGVKIPAKLKRILVAGWRSDICGYVYPDGLLFWEKRRQTVKGTDQETAVDVWHALPGVIQITQNDYSKEFSAKDNEPIARFVVHNARSLIDGVDRISVSWNNNSPASKERGIIFTSITLTTMSGSEYQMDSVEGVMSATFFPQRDVNRYGTFESHVQQVRESLKEILVQY